MQIAKNIRTKVIVEPKRHIRIKASENALKLPVARVCAEWLDAPERTWNFKGSVDENSKRLIHYLSKRFLDFEWLSTSSQSPFEVICLDAKVAIEVKSVKKGNKSIVANATMYPDKILASDVLPSKLKKNYTGNKDVTLDVLVVCVDRHEDFVYDYAIIDGAYWGITYEDYLSCKQFFNNINSDTFLAPLLEVYKDTYNKLGEPTSFVDKVLTNSFGKNFVFNLRKLIQLPNPVHFGTDTAGYWGIGG